MIYSFIPVTFDSLFPIQNLPYAAFSPKNGGAPRIGVRIGDFLLDLSALEQAGLLDAGPPHTLFDQPTMNRFMVAGRPVWSRIRAQLQELLSEDYPKLRDDRALRARVFYPANNVALHLPAAIGDYTDFYSSKEHATNMGVMIRGKDNPLMPNWLYLPVGYHGRASSVVVSGTDFHRPRGQITPDDAEAPVFSVSRVMDFELEMGYFIGPGNALGEPIPVEEAEERLFGMTLVNDWSSRDIQRWEYQPLGPFLSKNLATSIAPYVVPLEALEPFRCAGPEQNPPPLDYLKIEGDRAFDIHLEVRLQSAAMTEPVVISRSNFRYMYWNMSQQLAHHTVTGCNMRPGDLMASGTLSGPEPDSYGSMLELTWRGTRPLTLPGGDTRKFLEDGDRVTMTGWCEGDGYRIGFGEVTGRLLPAR
jgi:fumarylacetoacetase